IFVSSFSDTASGIQLVEAHENLAFSASPDLFPRMTSRHSAGASSPRYAIVWSTEFTPTDHDVLGALYDEQLAQSTCIPGGTGVIGWPCATPGRGSSACNNSSATGGAVLASPGVASVTADPLVFHTSGEKPTATSIVLQGTASLPAGTVFGQGV